MDDSSRKILSAVECSNANEKETIKLVQQVINEYGHIRKIREIITDHGTQFFCNKPNEDGELGINEFQAFLDGERIKHILCKYKHPQSNGKQEKWFDTYEKHLF
ncbi:DDE-type integrase/transposase/recombinase [Candidatus Woesearchaeota archaeon]|nr:DDE-type integrase/transposase/recombinase [Candidatus Woesearchaeota archaeon]